MKLITRLTILLMMSTVIFTSCKKSAPRQTKHIPKNAVFVAAINTKAITAKLAKSEATIENLFKSMAESDTAMNDGKKEWEEFRNAGIDLSENFYVSVVQQGGGMGMGGGNNVITGIGGLKDAAKLEAYIKKKQPTAQVKKEKDYSYAIMEGSTMVAWADDLVMVMNNSSSGGNMNFDSATGQMNFDKPADAETDMKTEMAAYFNMKEDESVATIPEFRELMQDNADGSFWINSASTMENMPIPLPKVKELVENSFTAATLNFEDGKVVVDTKSYSSSALNDILKKYAGPTVDLNMIAKYPSNNINGFLSFAFNPEIINAIVSYLELKAIADDQVTKIFGGALTVQDVTKALKGDMAIIVSDFTVPKADTINGAMPAASPMKMIINIPVGDKVQMNRLMDKLVEMGMMMKAGNEYRATEALSKSGYQVVVDDKNLLAASDLETLNQYKAGTAKAGISGDVMGGLKDKIAVVYVNIESLLNGFPVNANDAGMNAIMPKAKATFRDATGYADNFNGKFTGGHMELRFKNEKENSLVSLLQFFGEANKANKMGFGNQGDFEMEAIDSTTVTE